MVLTAVTPYRGCSKDTFTTTDHAQNSRERTRTTPANQEDGSDGMQIIRESLAAQGISQKARDIIVQSWRQGIQKQYSSYIKRWTSLCYRQQIDGVSSTISQALGFLVELYESGIGYSGINTARSSWSCVVKPINRISLGSHPTVTRFLKGVFESGPTAPRYTQTLDVGKVLSYLQTIPNSEDVSLKDLTLKTVLLVSLVSAKRGQTIHSFNLNYIISSETFITFALSKPLKQSKPGVRPMVVQFTSYPADPRICVVTTLKMYLARTRCKRGDYKQLFISYLKPFKPVSRRTISRWIKVVMCSSGINVEVFRPHSTRAAGTSKASASFVPLDQILSTAGWSSVFTFAKFYNKQIDVKNSFAEGVLQSVGQVIINCCYRLWILC